MLPFYEYKPESLYAWHDRGSDVSSYLHLHEHIELIFLEHGKMEVDMLNDRYILYPNQLMIIFPFTIHGVTLSVKSKYYFCICSPNKAGSFKNTIFENHPISPVLTSDRIHPDVPKILRELSQIVDNLPKQQYLADALFSLLLARTIPLMSLKPIELNFDMNMVTKVIRYMLKHYNENISLQMVADDLHISKFTLSHIFNNHLQMGFLDYLHSLRIENAKFRIANSNDRISEIAFDCGYESLRTFNRAFLRLTGTTPQEYKKIITVRQEKSSVQ